MSVVIETTIGDITVDLYLKERPNACLNFLKLCKVKYYNLCIFHKVERNFIAQTGDPTCTGRGGESIFCQLYGEQAKYFDAEMKPRLKHEKIGTLSMVNNGNNMNGSQFFLTLGENLTYLDEVHTVFGEVAEGFDILLKLNEAICDADNRPYQDIRITHTVILHDPFEDPAGLSIPDASPIPTKEQLESNYIAADEEIDDDKGKNAEEIEEKIKESEAKARATILEMIGDIPDADVKPPENVLFVCKLNPVTTSEDLEIIFSRFGPIISCEVIKDKKSGESLQYAFIEFEKEEDCENAYFKMDNVLIDDRRIHVDFSQSVSKLNFNAQNKLLKGKSGKFQNFIIKDKEKKSDGYEMIFDMDQSSASRSVDKKMLRDKYSDKKRKPSSSHIHEQNYKHKRKYFEDDQDFVNKKSKHSSKISESTEVGRSSKDKRISKSSPLLSTKRNSKYQDSSDQSDSYMSNKTYKKGSYHKKKRHDSSSSSRSLSPEPLTKHNKVYSSTSKDFHEKPERNSLAERKKYDADSPEFSQLKRKNSKQVDRSMSPEDSYCKYKSSRTYKSCSRSPESAHSKQKTSNQSYRSRSSEKHSKYKSSKQTHDKSPESSKSMNKYHADSFSHSKYQPIFAESQSFSKSNHRSRSPGISHRKSKAIKKVSSSTRSHSRSPVTSGKKNKFLKVQTRSPSSSSESSKYEREHSKHAAYHTSHPKTSESFSEKKRVSKPHHSRFSASHKNKSRRSRSDSRSSSSSTNSFNKKYASKHDNREQKHNHDNQSKYEKLDSKVKNSKNLTEYSDNSSSESDKQSSKYKSSSSKYYTTSSKKYSYKDKKIHK